MRQLSDKGRTERNELDARIGALNGEFVKRARGDADAAMREVDLDPGGCATALLAA